MAHLDLQDDRWTLVLSQWLSQQRLTGVAEGVLDSRSEVLSRIESVAGGRLDECVHHGRHFRSQDGLARVVILPAHAKSLSIVRLLARQDGRLTAVEVREMNLHGSSTRNALDSGGLLSAASSGWGGQVSNRDEGKRRIEQSELLTR